ncbi:hypothetical protein AEP_01716 [Curvibacter sp. AEP1-3]|uniref:hypothetical protein n=1 Tax=Curvibacter sp. AEP1-3 TaxID=1844971 RepID=UPI000B3D2993|nr:hypothetical protein [Curvibacter sp. AEP1-3]ARV18660.1 hypothetical protein AEP_01716 [Curvibacter sp. AEP1-3]
MNTRVLDGLLLENKLLQDQLNQLRYFLAGSYGLKLQVPDVQSGQSIYCAKEDLHHIAAGLLAPSVTCADIGAGLRPQRLMDCPVHVLVEPWRPYADRLVQSFPAKLVVNAFATPYLADLQDKSLDTIFLLDVIEHIEKEEGRALLQEALRVARVQVVLFTPIGFMPHEVHDTSADWGDVEHGITQQHLSGWTPQEMPHGVHVICEDYHTSEYGKFGAFYSILTPAKSKQAPRLVLVSDALPEHFALDANDVLVSDVRFIELSHLLNRIPKRNMLVVPLELMAEQSIVPLEILRRTIINLPILQHYVQHFEQVLAFGNAAQAVLQRLQQRYETT